MATRGVEASPSMATVEEAGALILQLRIEIPRLRRQLEAPLARMKQLLEEEKVLRLVIVNEMLQRRVTVLQGTSFRARIEPTRAGKPKRKKLYGEEAVTKFFQELNVKDAHAATEYLRKLLTNPRKKDRMKADYKFVLEKR